MSLLTVIALLFMLLSALGLLGLMLSLVVEVYRPDVARLPRRWFITVSVITVVVFITSALVVSATLSRS